MNVSLVSGCLHHFLSFCFRLLILVLHELFESLSLNFKGPLKAVADFFFFFFYSQPKE